jgi:ATP-dependent helicase HepA
MHRPSVGQRWISTSEPALGLGIIEKVEHDIVTIYYPAAEETRTYAFSSAPIVRVLFNPGDEIFNRAGLSIVVRDIILENDNLTYRGDGGVIPEEELLDSLGFTRPDKRLLAGLTDHPRMFDQRLQALEWNTRIRRSPARGFTGARIDLIPHQLAIVGEAAGRLHPRVLLSDEVGLGKTIEACLILHRLHLTGRAGRILVLVPESLVHQWFVELLRRFNLLFAIFDQPRCESIEANDPECNPFLDSQLILVATDLLTNHPDRLSQAASAGFDLLVVDEAHHLEWTPNEESPAYSAVASLARGIPAVLLLTATPQQLGPAGHFARLRILDPERYADLDAFTAECSAYGPLVESIEGLKNGALPASLDTFAGQSPRAAKHIGNLRSGDESARKPLIAELIDSFGTGRVLFRNTRERLTGFPARIPHLHPLEKGISPYTWLADLLRELPETEKVLLITSSPEAAIAVQEKLLSLIHVEAALFHEDLTLLQRDRNAAWFADPEGARILICSEIGSEGRNFQFARQLVLFGLPRDPELLEQRIGRLDRIGQTRDIHFHIPYGVHDRSEYHARWLHEGLDAFSRPLKGATALAATLLPELDQLLDHVPDEVAFTGFLNRSRELARSVARELESGHDRLLELGSPQPEDAAPLLRAIQTADGDTRFERFVIRLFDHHGLNVTDLSPHAYHFQRGQFQSDAFADLPDEGLSATFHRATALAREDLAFITPDHPVFLDALGQLLDGTSGNATFGHWKTGTGKAVFLECAFVVEVIAPSRIHIDRFLPPTNIRVAVDHRGEEMRIPPPAAVLSPGDPGRIIKQDTFRRDLFPKMLAACRAIAATNSEAPIIEARQAATETLTGEIERLTDLASRNPQVSGNEISALLNLREEILAALASPRLRLDALRLIWRD